MNQAQENYFDRKIREKLGDAGAEAPLAWGEMEVLLQRRRRSLFFWLRGFLISDLLVLGVCMAFFELSVSGLTGIDPASKRKAGSGSERMDPDTKTQPAAEPFEKTRQAWQNDPVSGKNAKPISTFHDKDPDANRQNSTKNKRGGCSSWVPGNTVRTGPSSGDPLPGKAVGQEPDMPGAGWIGTRSDKHALETEETKAVVPGHESKNEKAAATGPAVGLKTDYSGAGDAPDERNERMSTLRKLTSPVHQVNCCDEATVTRHAEELKVEEDELRPAIIRVYGMAGMENLAFESRLTEIDEIIVRKNWNAMYGAGLRIGYALSPGFSVHLGMELTRRNMKVLVIGLSDSSEFSSAVSMLTVPFQLQWALPKGRFVISPVVGLDWNKRSTVNLRRSLEDDEPPFSSEAYLKETRTFIAPRIGCQLFLRCSDHLDAFTGMHYRLAIPLGKDKISGNIFDFQMGISLHRKQ
ncbi:MAG: hypothetical protein JNL88_08810 [Bacteroidia bacterium]|nr:hypothetical protein [Bacteroidia bacterium]